MRKNARSTPAGRAPLVERVVEQDVPVATVAQGAAVSVRTAWKWVGRWRAEGPARLQDRSSRPRRSPCPATPRARAVLILCTLPLLGSCLTTAANRERARNAAIREADVDQELELVLRAMARNGWEPVGESQRGNLEESYDESDDVYFDIPATGQWGVIGVCDGTCSDLDLELFDDRSGVRVARDVEPGARPSIRFTADSGDRVRVRVTAPTCQARANGLWLCRYGVQLVRR